MAEVLVEFPEPVRGEDDILYSARACGAPAGVHLWHGWIEFEPVDGGEPIRSPRETTQPNRVDTHYWATGLTEVYLQGALRRAQHPLVRRPAPPTRPAAFEGPAPDMVPPASSGDAVLNPFSVYGKSEALLRRQLAALSTWHLVNIVNVYGIETETDPNGLQPSALIEAIVQAARLRATAAAAE